MENNLATKYALVKAMSKYLGEKSDEMKAKLADQMADGGIERQAVTIGGKKVGTVTYTRLDSKPCFVIKDIIAYDTWCEQSAHCHTVRVIDPDKLPDNVWGTLVEMYPDAACQWTIRDDVSELGELVQVGDMVVMADSGECVPGVVAIEHEGAGRVTVTFKQSAGGYLGALDAAKDAGAIEMLLPGGEQ